MNWNKQWIYTLMGIALMLSSIGCATSGLQAGDASYSNSPYLVIDDITLASQVSIAKVSHDMVGNIMRAQVTLKSNRHRTLRLQYRFSWYDGNGMEIDSQGQPYEELLIQGKDSISVNDVAPSPYAEEFKIRVKKVKAIKIDNIR